MTVPPRGETSAVFLADGRPVFVVHHQDGTVSVVDAFSSHRAWGVEELNVWCPSTREFVEVAHEAHFDEYGTLTPLSGPAGAGGVATFAFAVVATDAVGDPSQIRVEDIREPTHAGTRLRCGAATVLPCERRSLGRRRPHLRHRVRTQGRAAWSWRTGSTTSRSGIRRPRRWRPPRPGGWPSGGRCTWTQDGFVQLCAQVVDDRCEGGVVVRGVDGIGLYAQRDPVPGCRATRSRRCGWSRSTTA